MSPLNRWATIIAEMRCLFGCKWPRGPVFSYCNANHCQDLNILFICCPYGFPPSLHSRLTPISSSLRALPGLPSVKLPQILGSSLCFAFVFSGSLGLFDILFIIYLVPVWRSDSISGTRGPLHVTPHYHSSQNYFELKAISSSKNQKKHSALLLFA